MEILKTYQINGMTVSQRNESGEPMSPEEVAECMQKLAEGANDISELKHLTPQDVFAYMEDMANKRRDVRRSASGKE